MAEVVSAVMNHITIFTDGGSRGNPGPAAYGFVVKMEEKEIYAEGKTLGITTNNVAEYTAVLQSLVWVKDHRESVGEFSGIDFKMDSLLACQQLKGVFKIKQPHLRELFERIRLEERQLGIKISYTHIRREFNKEADAMVNKALDGKI